MMDSPISKKPKMTTNTTMKAVHYHLQSDEFSIVDNDPLPLPNSDEIRVKVLATALNQTDAKVMYWKGSIPGNLEHITLGLDVCGVVDMIGSEVTTIQVGDTVLYHGRNKVQHGGFAEYAIHDALTTIVIAKAGEPLSDDFDPVALAATPCAAWTAYRALYEKLHIPPMMDDTSASVTVDDDEKEEEWNEARQHKTIIIVGASGGVGSFALQMAKLSGMSNVIAVCSSKHEEYVRRLGATAFIDYETESIYDGIQRITTGKNVDYILDCVGSSTTKEAMRCLNYDGVVCPLVCWAECNLMSFLSSHVVSQLFLTSAHTRGLLARKHLQRCGKKVTKMLLSTKEKPSSFTIPVTKVISLGDVPQELTKMLENHTTGKIVMKVM